MKKSIFAVLVLILAQPALAEHTAFSCVTNSGKTLAVVDGGSHYRYSYGFPGKPDLVFTNSKRQVQPMCGKYECGVTLTHKGVDYNIAYWGEDLGVTVTKGGKTLANVACRNNRAQIANF
ncbi:hypothetical protein L4G92_02075 [Neisseria sp. ZJ106]|uniref:Uncharacterized protein n=1 Tax=Neisseria lisongii TaxID=2912188 RepID=A0ABY7RKI6_9NEIS|nr:hypothetical protein [Neisseria lisongii]MCF7520840.1 hypothetical protein [Neisseria lisongii]WCL70775.1 hypothetical protein PJU73_05145 [Neisseria lisongii]